MTYGLTVDQVNGILIAKHEGTLNVQEAIASRAEGIPLLIERRIRKVLIDLRGAQITASPTEIFEFQSTEPREYPLGTRVAMVLSPQSWAEKDVKFAVNVARNRGLIERAFTSLKEALSWLTEANA